MVKLKRAFGVGRYEVLNNGVKIGEVWKISRHGCTYWKNDFSGKYLVNERLHDKRSEAVEDLLKKVNQ